MDTKFNVGSRVITESGDTGLVIQVTGIERLVKLDGADEHMVLYFVHDLREEPKTITYPSPSPKEVQVGGSHYKDMAIQPIDYILANGLGFAEGACVKYLSRWKVKGEGVTDLKKARHILDLLIDHVERRDAIQEM